MRPSISWQIKDRLKAGHAAEPAARAVHEKVSVAVPSGAVEGEVVSVVAVAESGGVTHRHPRVASRGLKSDRVWICTSDKRIFSIQDRQDKLLRSVCSGDAGKRGGVWLAERWAWCCMAVPIELWRCVAGAEMYDVGRRITVTGLRPGTDQRFNLIVDGNLQTTEDTAVVAYDAPCKVRQGS